MLTYSRDNNPNRTLDEGKGGGATPELASAPATLRNRKPTVSRIDGSAPSDLRGLSQQPAQEEVIMKKLIFIAFVVIAGLAVILDDGKPHPRMYRHH